MSDSKFNSIVNEIRNILRKDGITNMDSVNHCVAFYILRIIDETLCDKLSIPKKFIFDNFNKNENGVLLKRDELFAKFYTPSNIDNPDDPCFVYYLINVFNMNEIGEFKLKKESSFEEIFELLKKIDVNELVNSFDIVGMIYENHLASGSNNARDLGQFFTHRKVIKFMIDLCDPKIKPNGEIESILDPSMGTGGFLTMATKYLKNKYNNIDWSINSKYIYGCDIDDRLKTLAKLNMLIETGETMENLVNLDTLHKGFIFNDEVLEKFDNILANEPFGIKNIIYKDICERVKTLKINGTKCEPLFLQLMMISLKLKGRCAVIVPDGVLFNDAKLHHDTRKYLIEKMNLKKVISLEGDFFMNTGVKSSILYFVNDGTTQEVEFSKIKLVNGDIIEENIKKVKKDILVAKDYTLFINKYIESVEKKLEGIEYKKINQILNDVKYDIVNEDNNGNINYYTCSPLVKKCNKTSISGNYILIGTRGTISNAIHYINGDIGLGNNMFAFSILNDNILLKYIYYYLQINKSIIDKFVTQTAVPMISKKNFNDIEIPIPSLDIQKQIVDILDNDYNIIKTNKELIKMYEARKKNIIWCNTISQKTINLVELADFKSGKYNSSDAKEEGLYPFYNSEAKNPVGFSDNYCFDYENYIILIKDGGAGQGKYGNQIGLGKVFLVNGKSSATSHQLAIIPKTQNNTKFIYYYLQYIKNKIMDLANYTTGLGTIRKSEIEDIKIHIPTSEIQQQIVSQCEQIDSFIANLEKEIQTIESSNIINIILKSITTATTTSTTTNTNSSNNETNEITGQPNQLVNPEVTSEDVSSKPIKKKVLSKPIVKKTSTPVQEVIINE